MSEYSHCICPGEWDEGSQTLLSDPKVKERDISVRLRTLVDAADQHRKVNEFHWRSSMVNADEVYGRWVVEMERLETVI